jgi:hypothetical protein
MENSKLIYLFIMFILTFIFTAGLSTLYHELAHKEIDKMHGLTNVSIKVTWTGMQTIGYGDCDSTCKLANDMNEVIGYNLQGFYLLVFGGLFVYGVIKLGVAE